MLPTGHASPSPAPPVPQLPVSEAAGIEKAYRRGVWAARRSLQVLRGVDVSLAPGEVVGLVGENGSGKSTLMKILVGALSADAGTVSYQGRLGYCPQEPVVCERLTCDEHFELFGRAYGMAPRRSAAPAGRSTSRWASSGMPRPVPTSCPAAPCPSSTSGSLCWPTRRC